MNRTTIAGVAAVVAASGAAGWLLGSRSIEHHTSAIGTASTEQACAIATALPPAMADSVTVFGDGTVAIQLHKASVPWLLDEIVRQGGSLPGAGSASPVAPLRVAAAPASCPDAETAESAAADATKLVQALRDGNEAQRLEALSKARSDDVPLPGDLLRQLVDADPSSRVRLAAFKAYADANSNDVDRVRAALEVGRYNHSEAVQAEARRRLEQLERGQAMQPVNDPQRSQ